MAEGLQTCNASLKKTLRQVLHFIQNCVNGSVKADL